MLGNTQAVLTGLLRDSGGGTYTALVVAVDGADNYGNALMGLRSVEFFDGVTLVDVAEIDIAGSGETSRFSNSYQAKYAFITGLSKTGSDNIVSWMSSSQDTNQRIWLRFTNPISFTSVVINNYLQGTNLARTDRGMQNTKILISETSQTPGAFGTSLTDGSTIFDGVFDEHAAVDAADPQVLTLI